MNIDNDKIEFFIDANLHNEKKKSVENVRLYFRTNKSFLKGLTDEQKKERIEEKIEQVSTNPVFGIHNASIGYSFNEEPPKGLDVNTKIEVRIPYCLHIPEETFLPIKFNGEITYAAFHKQWTDRAKGSSNVDLFQESKVTYFQKASILPGRIPQEEGTGWDINPTGINVEKINDATGLFRYTKIYLYLNTLRNVSFKEGDYFLYYDELLKVKILEIINHVVDIYRFCTREIHVERTAHVNITDVFFYDIQEGIHPISPYIEAAIMNRSKQEIDKFSEMLYEGDRPPLYELLLLSAERSLNKHMLTLAIVESYQALEIYLENFLLKKYIEKGQTKDEIEEKMKKCWKTSERLKKGLAESAGFSLTEDKNLWENWLKSYKDIRNKVIHEGKKSTYQEAEEVLKINYTVINFIKEKLENKNNMKTILVDAIHGLVIKGEGLFKEMHDLLETYPNNKIILTGANDEQMDMFGLHDMPYELFTQKHDPEKTDPTYYTKMLEHFGLNAADVIYFEHSEEAVKSAKSVGIKTYFYDSEERDLGALKEWLDGEV